MPTIDASAPVPAEGTAVASLATASFTPPANSKLVALITTNSAGGARTITSVTNSGTLLTWTMRRRANAQDGTAEIWTADVATSAAMTVTATPSATEDVHIVMMVFTDVETGFSGGGGSASNNSGLPTTGSMTGLTIGSYMVAVSSDWNAAGLGTLGTGQTFVDEWHTAGRYTSHVWRTTTTLSGTTQTMNLTAPAAQDYNIASIEIKGPSTTPPTRPRSYIQAVRRSVTH